MAEHSHSELGSKGVVVLQDTFARAKTWVKELQRQASPSIVIALAGNKADIANKRMVEFDVSSSGAVGNILVVFF